MEERGQGGTPLCDDRRTPFCVGSYVKQRPEGQDTENKVTEGPEVLRTSIMEQVARLDALQNDIPRYVPNSFAIGQPVQDAPLVRATS